MTSRLALLALLLLPAAPFRATAETPKPPNLLFVFCDDLTVQAVSAYGHPLRLLETPNIDRVAREGILFERTLVTNSICGPSRAAVLTGKYSHKNGFYTNRSVFDGSQDTFPKQLQEVGYQTAMIGKWHLVSDPTGFDHWHILPGQGLYYNPPMIRDGEQVTHTGYTTDLINEFSLEWLRNRDKDRPFLLMSQHKAPHREWAPALRHLGWNGEREFPEPETLHDDYSGRGIAELEQEMTLARHFTERDSKVMTPPYLNDEQRAEWEAYYGPRNQAFLEAELEGEDLVRWRYQRYMHDYLGTVIAVDEALGALLDYLDEEGIADETLVVFTSDQGFYLGEHGWYDKRWIYEESLTTPLVARWPGVIEPGSRSAAMASVIDFAPTFLEIAGAPVYEGIQGRSLLPILQGETPEDWRDSFYYHYYEFPGAHAVRKHYGVVTDRYKLFHFYEPETDYWTLIDREVDPHELQNLYGSTEYAAVQGGLHEELERLRAELEVPAVDPPESLPDYVHPSRAKGKGKGKGKANSN